MQIMWNRQPSEIVSVESSIIDTSQANNIVQQPRGRFARFKVSDLTGLFTIRPLGGSSSSTDDRAGFLVTFRTPRIERDGSGDPVIVDITISGPSAADAFVSVSGSGGFADVSLQTSGPLVTTFRMTHFDSPFTGWVTLGFRTTNNSASAAVAMNGVQGVSAASDAILADIGYCQITRLWSPPNFISSRQFYVDPVDPSVTQRSDGGQQFATRIDKRRSVGFDFVPSDEEQFVISDDPETGGIMTIADQIGITQPVMLVPSLERPLSQSMNILGTVREWPALVHLENGLWEMRGLIVDELL